MNDEFYVYRYFSVTGALLYVGCSNDPYGTRAAQHKSRSAWFVDAVTMTVSSAMARAAAYAIERAVIVDERPLHNVRLTPSATTGIGRFIEKIGDRAFAASVGAERRTVTDWRLGNRIPRPAMAQKIVAIHRGKVSMADIYGAAK